MTGMPLLRMSRLAGSRGCHVPVRPQIVQPFTVLSSSIRAKQLALRGARHGMSWGSRVERPGH